MKTIDTKTAGQVVLAAAVISGLVFTPAGDQAFFAIVMLAPLATGFIAAALGRDWRPAAATWALVGVVMLAYDWGANDEDKAFHLVLTVLMVALVWSGATIARARFRPASAGPRRRRVGRVRMSGRTDVR
jgi:hypothetical protein